MLYTSYQKQEFRDVRHTVILIYSCLKFMCTEKRPKGLYSEGKKRIKYICFYIYAKFGRKYCKTWSTKIKNTLNEENHEGHWYKISNNFHATSLDNQC